MYTQLACQSLFLHSKAGANKERYPLVIKRPALTVFLDRIPGMRLSSGGRYGHFTHRSNCIEMPPWASVGDLGPWK